MQIQKIYPSYSIYKNQPELKNRTQYSRIAPQSYVTQSPSYVHPSFGSNILTKLFPSCCSTNVLLKDFEFTAQAYNKLPQKVIKTLRQRYLDGIKDIYDKEFYNSLEFSHEIAANSIRAVCEESFGKDNYKIITIGRSLSSIGRYLGYRIGEKNVVNIPMSEACRFNSDKYIRNQKKENFIEFRKFLENSGLKKEELEQGKHYVVMDYCASGASLKGAHNLLSSHKIWGEQKNLHAGNIEDILNAVVFDDIAAELASNILLVDLHKSQFKMLSFVDKCLSLKKTNEAIINKNTVAEDIKLIWFKLLDNAVTGKIVHVPTVESFPFG